MNHIQEAVSAEQLADQLMANYEVDILNCLIAETNATNAILGKPERFEYVNYFTV